jgi:hypothetical protein
MINLSYPGFSPGAYKVSFLGILLMLRTWFLFIKIKYNQLSTTNFKKITTNLKSMTIQV